MEPTFEQLETIIAQLSVLVDTVEAIHSLTEEVIVHLIYISKVALCSGGLIWGTMTWRNFILAKNQRYLL